MTSDNLNTNDINDDDQKVDDYNPAKPELQAQTVDSAQVADRKRPKKILTIILVVAAILLISTILIIIFLMNSPAVRVYRENIEPKGSQTGNFCGYKQSSDKTELLNSKNKIVVKSKSEIKICGDGYYLIATRLFDSDFNQLTSDSITVYDPPYYSPLLPLAWKSKTSGWFEFKDEASSKLGVIDKTGRAILSVTSKDQKDEISLNFNNNIKFSDNQKYGEFSWSLVGDSIGSAIINLSTGKRVYQVSYPYQTSQDYQPELRLRSLSNNYNDKQVFIVEQLEQASETNQASTRKYSEQAHLFINDNQIDFRKDQPSTFYVVDGDKKILKVEDRKLENGSSQLIRSYFYDIANQTETDWDISN